MEMESMEGGRPVHVLAIPFPLHGHVFPLLWLSKRLALSGVTVTFLAYEATIHHITSQQNADDDHVYGKTLHFKSFPKIERPEVPRTSPANIGEVEQLRKDLEPYYIKYIRDKNEGRDLPTCIVSDMFLLWTQDLADQLEIPRYMLITSGATLALLTADFQRLHEAGEFQISRTDGRLIENDKGYSVPGLPHLFYHEIPPTITNIPKSFLKRSQILWRSSGLLINTFTELEDQIIERYKDLNPPQDYGSDKKVPKLFAVGPMRSPTPDLVRSVSLNQAQQSPADVCLAWLSSQPHSSVLYVAFGTLVSVAPSNIRELAFALEASQQRFLWAMRGSSSEALPDGFEARVSERGFVFRGLAPQVEILAHPSTAAFLTHCGWNSILESVLLGVPMIGWPCGADQHLNCRDLMDRLKILEQIQTGPENVLRQSEALRVIRLVMGEEGKLIKERIKRLQRFQLEASAESGQQSRELQSFVDDLRRMG